MNIRQTLIDRKHGFIDYVILALVMFLINIPSSRVPSTAQLIKLDFLVKDILALLIYFLYLAYLVYLLWYAKIKCSSCALCFIVTVFYGFCSIIHILLNSLPHCKLKYFSSIFKVLLIGSISSGVVRNKQVNYM